MMKRFHHTYIPSKHRTIYICLLLLASACIVYAAKIPDLPQLPFDITDVGIPNGPDDCPDPAPAPAPDPVDDPDCSCDDSPATTPATPILCDPFYGLYGQDVTVVVEGDVALTGEFKAVCKGFVIIQNRLAGRHDVININKICYVELTAQ